MITFRRIPHVQVGDPVTSVEMIALADGVRDRILSGLGDPTRRIHFYLSAASRQIRNPDGSGLLFPPVDEFRAGYEHVHPADSVWPITGPGEPEGINVSSTLGSFVFGNEALNVSSEDARLTDPVEGGIDLDPGTGTPLEIWQLAKRQRGAIDPEAGAVASPAFAAAQSHFAIIQSERSPHGNSYGGFVPTPEFLGSCADPDEDGVYQLIFTPVVDGLPVRTFEGYCASEPTHVSFIRRFPGDRYEIVQNDGTVTVLSWSEYIEGPYAFGNRLTKTWGNHINRLLNHFISEFDGTAAQKASEDTKETPWLTHSIDVHRFLTTQYHLAPQRGHVTGDSVVTDYPGWKISNSLVQTGGTLLLRTDGSGTDFGCRTGFLTTAVVVWASQLIGSARVRILDGEIELGTIDLTAESSSAIGIIEPRKASQLRFVLDSDASFSASSATAGIFAEATELMEYKPRLWDLALLLRCGGARIEVENGTDGNGADEDQSREIGEDYFTFGAILNRRSHVALPGSFAEINTNAVFEAARKMQRRCSRLIPRENLVGYEVTASGKSVLYFRREWMGNSAADVFEGIGPARAPIESGFLAPGREYIVDTATVTYKGTVYAVGQRFTADESDLSFQTTSGRVYEANGILPDALERGWSNEWVLDVLSLLPYSNLETSVWKPSVFTDYVSWATDRCTWNHPTPVPKHLSWHFQYGSNNWISPESFPSFRYVGSKAVWPSHQGINDLPCAGGDTACEEDRRRKLRSCPIGELPLYVESTERLVEDGAELIKVTLSSRLQHGTDAPATIDRDLSTWDLVDIQAEIESGRTQENGIREYLIHQFVGGDCVGPGSQFGNAAHNSTIATSLDVPNGACYPRIGFIRLPPKPFTDGGINNSSKKTPMESWVFGLFELYARCICEGYVDQVSTERYGCETGTYAVLDYTFESACFQAFGGRAFGCVQSEATSLAPEAEVRPDKPMFHGFLQNTYPSAEIFNQFASFFNQLEAVRLMLPIQFQSATGDKQLVEVQKLRKADGIEVGCTLGQVNPGVFGKFASVDPGEPALGPFSDDTFASASHAKAIDDFACDGGGDWRLVHNRTDGAYRWRLVSDDYLEAIPVSWRDMIESNGLLLGIRETTISWEVAELVSTPNGEDCNGIGDFWSGGGGEIIRFNTQTQNMTECKLLPISERIVAPLPPASAVGVGRVFDAGDLIYCVINAGSGVSVTPVPADALILRATIVDP